MGKNPNQIQRLIKSLQWGESKGLTSVDIEVGGEHRLSIKGTLPNGETLWLIPMSTQQKKEEYDDMMANKPPKKETPISVYQGDRKFGDIGSGDFTGEYRDSDYINESIEKIKSEFKRYL
jgi:hypothetical protein